MIHKQVKASDFEKVRSSKSLVVLLLLFLVSTQTVGDLVLETGPLEQSNVLGIGFHGNDNSSNRPELSKLLKDSLLSDEVVDEIISVPDFLFYSDVFLDIDYEGLKLMALDWLLIIALVEKEKQRSVAVTYSLVSVHDCSVKLDGELELTEPLFPEQVIPLIAQIKAALGDQEGVWR